MNPNYSFPPKHFQQCEISVMDNIADPHISFDNNGVSNYYHEYNHFSNQLPDKESRLLQLNNIITQIKEAGIGHEYDCIIGISGGLDSSYLVYYVTKLGLRPLLVHFDYSWNTEQSVSNIESLVSKLNLELKTVVFDWEMIRDIHIAYFKASVLDLDVPADNLITGSLFKIASDLGIKYILNGSNYQTEYVLPLSWRYLNTDLINIKKIHKMFGNKSFKWVCTNGLFDQIYYGIKGIKSVSILNYLDYNLKDAIAVLENEIGWKDFGSKHHENIFTRFFQGVYLPNKFGIDKRKAHLSNLIFSGQMTKSRAVELLNGPTYDLDLQQKDKEYIAIKLGFSMDEFESILNKPNQSHESFGTDKVYRRSIYYLSKLILPNKYKQMVKDKIYRQ